MRFGVFFLVRGGFESGRCALGFDFFCGGVASVGFASTAVGVSGGEGLYEKRKGGCVKANGVIGVFGSWLHIIAEVS